MAAISTAAIANAPATPAARKQDFINHMVTAWGFKRDYLNKLLLTRPANERILKAINTPYEAKPWVKYEKHFLTKSRISGGDKYWNEHQATLNLAQKKYGVAPEVIVAIVGIESHYGQHKGVFPVIDALNTLAFYYPKRSEFFSKQLDAFLRLARKDDLNPTQIKGSYAGAIGLPQFMPSSILAYGVHQAGEKIDLESNNDDAILSIANYLHKHGWQKSIKPAAIVNKPENNTLAQNSLIEKVQENILMVPTETKPEYWQINKNFHAIMAYNPRYAYAMAVTQLSMALANNRNK